MLALAFRLLFLWQLLVIVTCDHLIVNTKSGPVRGIEQTTLLSNKTYISYKGIPFAEPPVGELRFRVPVPIAPWRETLHANNYGNSCLVISPELQLFPLNSTRSENCLYLNIFTPGQTLTSVLGLKKKDARKAVMFFIHGGAFTEGDSTNGFYGPDFMLENDVVLVTFNYRLGPFGFANFELPGFTGNMGFKDQQLALEWTKRNIEYFGGDPNLITVFGESAGGVSVHLHTLSDRSRKCMKRAITISGVAFSNFAHYSENNHIKLLQEIFDLGQHATKNDVLKFMINAPADLIVRKTPPLSITLGALELFWSAVVEDAEKAEKPFLTQNPRDIYKKNKIDIEIMFAFNSAEYLVLLNPADPYSWLEPVKNYSIGLPFVGLSLSPDSHEYRSVQKMVYEFYFGTGEILPNAENLNQFIQMNTDINFVYAIYEAMKIHSKQAKTFCNQNNLDLNLNIIKADNSFQEFYGTAHFEDIPYLFRSDKYSQIYDDIVANPTELTNQKTLNALQFVPKIFTDYAKTGSPGNFRTFTEEDPHCLHITNDGLEPIIGPRQEAMQFWDKMYDIVKPWIVNQF